MHEADSATLKDQVPRQGVRKTDSRERRIWAERPNGPRIRWTTPLGTTPSEESGIEQKLHPAGSIVYDELDRRLMDTFPASDAVARY